jgi:hypothetical protein
VRGILNQLHQFLRWQSRQQQQQSNVAATPVGGDEQKPVQTGVGLVTMSAGNYGKAFAFITAAVAAAAETDEQVYGVNAASLIGRRLVVMPSSAPSNRQTVIEVRTIEDHRARHLCLRFALQ